MACDTSDSLLAASADDTTAAESEFLHCAGGQLWWLISGYDNEKQLVLLSGIVNVAFIFQDWNAGKAIAA